MRGMNKLYFIKLEIEEIKDEIKSITEISSAEITGMPHGATISNPTEQNFLKKEKLIEKLEKKVNQYIDELIRIEGIIDNIENEEVRLIARLRFIQNLKWDEISRKVNFDRSVCYRKLDKYLKGIDKV